MEKSIMEKLKEAEKDTLSHDLKEVKRTSIDLWDSVSDWLINIMNIEIQLIFAWYDFWMGLFYDREKRWLYIFILPMCGIILKIPFPKDYCKFCKKAPCERLGLSYDEDDED